jgi:hypothetical protein
MSINIEHMAFFDIGSMQTTHESFGIFFWAREVSHRRVVLVFKSWIVRPEPWKRFSVEKEMGRGMGLATYMEDRQRTWVCDVSVLNDISWSHRFDVCMMGNLLAAL